MKPTLSIIIVNFNTPRLTLECLDSIKKENSNIDYEIVAVDNGSRDGSVEALRKIEDKNFKLIENKENLGFAKANNQGIKVAKGKYILLLNSDTKVKEKALGKLIDFAKETHDAGVVGAKLFNPDGSIQASCYRFPTLTNAIKEYWLGHKGAYEKYAPKGKKAQVVDITVATAFLITPKAAEKVGQLDERYFFYLEDFDYCRRIWRAGLKVYYLPEAEVIHYHGASGRKLADSQNQWRRLIPGSKIYHGVLKHSILTLVLWLGQKWQKFRKG